MTENLKDAAMSLSKFIPKPGYNVVAETFINKHPQTWMNRSNNGLKCLHHGVRV